MPEASLSETIVKALSESGFNRYILRKNVMFLKPMESLNMSKLRKSSAMAAVAASLALAGCGGGGTTGSTFSGKAIDGYLQGATVCLDVNRNGSCDTSEPQATTDASGNFSISVPDGYDNAGHVFLVDVPPTAVDSDSPTTLVGKSFKLRASFYQRSVITPLTTVLNAYAEKGLSASQATADLGLPAGFDFSKDYVASSDIGAHNVAKVVARILQTQTISTASELVAAITTYQTAIQTAADASDAYKASDLDSAIGVIVPEAPTSSAPAPTADPVIAIYSNAYTQVAGVDTNPNWGQATKVRELEVATGDKLLQLTGLNYQGLTFAVQDVSSMNSLHVDVWSLAGGTVTLGVITSGAQTGGDPLQTDVAITLTAGWNAINIPLSSYSKPDLKKVDQMVWAASGSPTIYVDNLYFWKDPNQVTSVATGTLPGTLENFDGSATPTLGDYGQGGETTVAAGPTGGNGQAGKFVKKLGNPSWNGMYWTMSSPLTFHGASATVTTRVWVDTAATANELYVETAAGGSSQVKATSAGPWVANSWQTVTWSFTGLDPNAVYTVMGFAPNRTTNPVADETYYVDDISLVVPLENFDGSATPTLGDYGQGGETTVAAGPTGGNGQAGKFVKKLGNPSWNGMYWTMSSPLTFHGASATVTTRVWVDTAATANELYVETAAGGSSQVKATSAGPWVANSWQTVTWSFTGLDPNAVYTVMGFAPNRTTNPVADETYYVDDIVLTTVTP